MADDQFPDGYRRLVRTPFVRTGLPQSPPVVSNGSHEGRANKRSLVYLRHSLARVSSTNCFFQTEEYDAKTVDRIWFDDGSGFWYIDLFNDENTDALLPKIVADWAGLHSRDPSVFIQWCGVENLSQVNDRGSDFKTIANLIEKQL